MHEFAVVQELVNRLLRDLERDNVKRVEIVHFRRGSAFSEDALLQAYHALTPGTPLAGAAVIIDTVNLNHECSCGRKQVITSDDLIGHMFICPQCGTMREIDEPHDLELVEVTGAREVTNA